MRFFHAKKAWHEVTLPTLLSRPTPNAVLHLFVAALAVGLVVAARRVIPRSWSWLTGLYLTPSLALGVIGMARYATDCFPPAVAAGAVLERRSRRATVAVVTGLAFSEVASAMFFIARGSLI